MQTTPIVAAVPKAVPMRNDMSDVRAKVASGAAAGVTRGDAMTTTCEMVPLARHRAVRMPMSTKLSMTPRAVETPERAMRTSSAGSWPRMSP